MWFQWFSVAGLVGFSLEFFVQFAYNCFHQGKLCLDPVDLNTSAMGVWLISTAVPSRSSPL